MREVGKYAFRDCQIKCCMGHTYTRTNLAESPVLFVKIVTLILLLDGYIAILDSKGSLIGSWAVHEQSLPC